MKDDKELFVEEKPTDESHYYETISDYYKVEVSLRKKAFIGISGWTLMIGSIIVFFTGCSAPMSVAAMIMLFLGFGILVRFSQVCAVIAIIISLFGLSSPSVITFIFIAASVLGVIGTNSVRDGWEKYQIKAAEERGWAKAKSEI